MAMPTPSYSSSRTVSYESESTGFETGTILRAARTGRKFVEYELVYNPGQLDESRAQDLIDTWETANGAAGTFTFTAWDEATGATFRFLDDKLDLDVASIVSYGCKIRVQRVAVT